MEQFFFGNNWVIALLILWTLPWKGVALWKAVERKEKWWFVVILVLNTAAILEIIYIFIWCRKKMPAETSLERK